MAEHAPRILLTGFEPFPGAPVNPTEALVASLRAEPPAIDGIGAFRAELLPVDYRRIGSRLTEIGSDFAPDIAIHLGLAQGCRGFRLERVARNRYDRAKPDNSGFAPVDGPVCAAPATLAPTLPLQAIHDALVQEGLPVEWSDDAGGYLCNVTMTLSLAGACDGFSPAMSGFVHVGAADDQARHLAMLRRGAGIILRAVLASA